jgi:hypothetical protein
MISSIEIDNFRSIHKGNIPLGKITVLTGANNSGKSSILYGLMVLQDFIRNPNQSLEELFALPFINLGGFSGVLSNNPTDIKSDCDCIKLGVSVKTKGANVPNQVKYQLMLEAGKTNIGFNSIEGDFSFSSLLMSIGLPYTASMNQKLTIKYPESVSTVQANWNGIQASLIEPHTITDIEQEKILRVLNSPVEALSGTDFVPIARGFTKPYYNIVPMTGVVNSEEEIATLLKTEYRSPTLELVNKYLYKIANRVINVPTNGAPGLFSLMSKNTITGQSNFLVNEGSGTNQLVTILAKTFQHDKKLICIDEPEIHQHPSMVRALANSFVEIVNGVGDKQFLVSTHSEHFIQGLLENVSNNTISHEDIKIYHLTMSDTGTVIENQAVNAKGQVEGGLSHFYAAELAGLKSIFKLTD